MDKRKRKPATELATSDAAQLSDPALLTDIRPLIETARQQTARTVYSALVNRPGLRLEWLSYFGQPRQAAQTQYRLEIPQCLGRRLTRRSASSVAGRWRVHLPWVYQVVDRACTGPATDGASRRMQSGSKQSSRRYNVGSASKIATCGETHERRIAERPC